MLKITKALGAGLSTDTQHYEQREFVIYDGKAGFVSTLSNHQELREQNSSLERA